MLSGLSLILALSSADLYPFEPYDRSIPKPESILRYQAGDRQTTYREQELVTKALAAAAPGRVKEIPYGASVEGRPLRIFAISSPQNIAHLADIQRRAQAQSRGEAVPDDQPAIVWINECIHGNEPASFESSMWLIYNLAASRNPALESALEHTVVLVNPSYNPDGHERFAVWSNSVAVGSSRNESFEHHEPGVIHGRTNHYRFDMNRDRVAMSQPETQQEVAAFVSWAPQVYVDEHGQTPSYFFPPNPMSLNPNVDRERIKKWTDTFGRNNGKVFDAHGWQYFIKDVYDLYYAGYLDSFSCLSGAVGMTFETDGGYALAKQRPDGTVVTLHDGIIHHLATALTVIQTAAANRADLLASYRAYKHAAVTGSHAGSFRRVVVTSPDIRPLERLNRHLASMGIASSFTHAYSQTKTHDYWTGAKADTTPIPEGSLVIEMAQSQGQLAKAMLEPTGEFEPEFAKAQIEKRKKQLSEEKYPGAEATEFYDFTGWSLVYGYDLPAYWCEGTDPIRPFEPKWKRTTTPDSPVGYALRYTDENDILAAFDLLQEDVKAVCNPKPVKMAGVSFAPGTFFFLAARNAPDLRARVERIGKKRNVSFEPLHSTYPDSDRYATGSENMIPLRKPEIGIYFGDANMREFPSLWYLMERRFNLPFTPLFASAMSGDLSRYSTIVIPNGARPSQSEKLKEWVGAGGSLVCLGDDFAVGALVKLEKNKLEGGKDAGELPGSLFKAELDPRSFLSFGYTGDAENPALLAAPLTGSPFYKAKPEGGAAAKFSSDEKSPKLLAGWEWPDDTEKALKGAVYLHDEPMGAGHVIMFADDPTGRAMWPGLYRLVLDAMLFGAAPRGS